MHCVLFEKADLLITPVDCFVLTTEDLFSYVFVCLFIYLFILLFKGEAVARDIASSGMDSA
jgi:hypothetical protein